MNEYRIFVSNPYAVLGYIDSVSYKNKTFVITEDAFNAKTYKKVDKALLEIQKLLSFPITILNNFNFSIK